MVLRLNLIPAIKRKILIWTNSRGVFTYFFLLKTFARSREEELQSGKTTTYSQGEYRDEF